VNSGNGYTSILSGFLLLSRVCKFCSVKHSILNWKEKKNLVNSNYGSF
jgi:hypothetical protein